MVFRLEIETENAAFTEEEGGKFHEIQRILSNLRLHIEERTEGAIHDKNGNRVGTFWMEED